MLGTSFNLQCTDVHATTKLLRHIRTNSAAGPDDLSAFFLRNYSYSLAPNITYIFNLSISNHTFPSLWKHANVTPVYKKKGVKTDTGNYRPISILPILGRLLEKIVARQLQDHCDLNQIIPNEQFGFRKKSSCELALLAAQDKWLQDMDSGAYVGAIMIDMAKAFDSVQHNLLLEELTTIGCSENAVNWFTSYLSNRKQRVRVGHITTPWKAISKGVPQGSSLSPLLFNIFVRKLPSVSESDCFQFADDLTNSAADMNIDNLRTKLESIYEKTKVFCQTRDLQINLTKTQLIVFKSARKRIPDNFTILLDGVSLQPVNEVKLLGVTLDRHLTMANQIDATVTKCQGLLEVLRRATVYLPEKLLKMVYTSIIRSHLEYSSALVQCAAPTHLAKLDTVQKIASRIITNSDSRAHSAPLQTLLGLEPLDSRRKKHGDRTIRSRIIRSGPILR